MVKPYGDYVLKVMKYTIGSLNKHFLSLFMIHKMLYNKLRIGFLPLTIGSLGIF